MRYNYEVSKRHYILLFLSLLIFRIKITFVPNLTLVIKLRESNAEHFKWRRNVEALIQDEIISEFFYYANF